MKNMSRSLIEIFIRGKLDELKDSPERGARNLVDMALHFSNGRFQKQFFKMAEGMLHNEQSAYYRLIQDFVINVDSERLLGFGMNLGYNSLTAGARTIRELENQLRCNIPWSVVWMPDSETLENNPACCRELITQGKSMGIYTWVIFTDGHLRDLLPLVKEYTDCAFLLFCRSDEITGEMMGRAEEVNNLMFVVKYEDDADGVCEALRKRKLLYSVYVLYHSGNVKSILDDDLIYCLEALHPPFSFFLSDPSCPEGTQQAVYQYIEATRKEQNHKTMPVELYRDNCYIDGIISEEACTVYFDNKGRVCSPQAKESTEGLNYFESSLDHIFKKAFPKATLY